MSKFSRRSLFASGGALAGTAIVGKAPAAAESGATSPILWKRPSVVGAPSVAGLHLQFGKDAAREITVSWLTPVSVRQPRVEIGPLSRGIGRTVEAQTRTYRDGLSGKEVFVHHAAIDNLKPSTDYVYFASHRGSAPESGVFTTAPSGRERFTFTSFGDQAVSNLRREIPNGTKYPTYTSSQIGSQASADIVEAIERVSPLFNLLNGDLCYAAVGGVFYGQDRLDTWADWFISNSRSTRFRPWMPCPGNHENEKDNGPVGFSGYQTYFNLPDEGVESEVRGLWYSFTVGSVRVISLSNDDVAIQDGGDSYIRGYSGGAQERWLERELKAARSSKEIDWIVVCMHQPMISSTRQGNGSDLGVRQAWGPLFDQYGVDLVVSGHEHHYERSHPVRGMLPNDTSTPIPSATDQDVIDTSKGTLHMVIGGGGNFATSHDALFDSPRGRVIVNLSDRPSPVIPGHKDADWLEEEAHWASVQERRHPHGFAAFDVDPGSRASGKTRMNVTYYTFGGPYGELKPLDRFVLERPRSDK